MTISYSNLSGTVTEQHVIEAYDHLCDLIASIGDDSPISENTEGHIRNVKNTLKSILELVQNDLVD